MSAEMTLVTASIILRAMFGSETIESVHDGLPMRLVER
jgi:hypothetical protein